MRENPGVKKSRTCISCKRVNRAVIQKYNLMVCRHCFRVFAKNLKYIKE